jgi:hypothetical protein
MLRRGIIADVTSSNSDDSIRALCAKAIAVRDLFETEVVLAELRAAIEEYAICTAASTISVQPRLGHDHTPMVI